MQIPPFTLNRQYQEIGSEIESEVSKVLKGGQYIGGQEIAKFEESFSSLIGVENTIGCNSGTDALVLALRALDIGVGDEVITSGGMVGEIEKVYEDDKVDLIVSQGVTVKVIKSTIQSLLNQPNRKK